MPSRHGHLNNPWSPPVISQCASFFGIALQNETLKSINQMAAQQKGSYVALLLTWQGRLIHSRIGGPNR